MRPLRLIAHGPQGIALTDAAAVFVGAVVDETQVIDSRDTVLDSEICARGGWIDLPFPCTDFVGKRIERLYYPAFEHQRRGRLIHLNRMAVAANIMLRTLQSFQEGNSTEETVQKMVLSYQLCAVRMLGGKRGVVNSNMIASRVANSARGVLVVNADRHPEIVGIPSHIMRRIKLDDRDLVFVGREPTIWHGSIEVVRARSTNRNVIELHPLLFKQLGADCDGDTVYVYAVPKDPKCQEEAAEQVLGFTRQWGRWPAYMRLEDPSDYVDWEILEAENKRRTTVTGFSVTPREILEKSSRVSTLCERMGKDVADECIQIAKGIDEPTLKKYVNDQNTALLHMKIWMGPIGAVSNRLRVFAGMDKTLIASASHVSERLQQMLLDTKHHIGRREGYGVTHVLDILNRRGKFSTLSPVYLEDVVDELTRLGMDREAIWPIMAYLWLVYPFTKTVEEVYKGNPSFRIRRMTTMVRSFLQTRDMKKTLNRVIEYGKVTTDKDVKIETLVEAHRKHALGISDICKYHYPLMQLMNDRVMQDRDAAFSVAKEIFIDSKSDMNGVTSLAMKEALDVTASL